MFTYTYFNFVYAIEEFIEEEKNATKVIESLNERY